MAKNTGRGHRVGAVKGRSEFRHSNGTWVKRDTQTGRIMNVSDAQHKGGLRPGWWCRRVVRSSVAVSVAGCGWQGL